MAKNRKVASTSRAFVVMEATSFHGGFPAYMNMIMSQMEIEMSEAGFPEPYKWRFSGGDGYAVPVHMHCEVT